MVNYCCKCSRRGPGLFSFPPFAQEQEIWKQNLELPQWFSVQGHSRVCFRHFPSDSYDIVKGRYYRKLGKN